MSATDELRRLLDERGVEHYDHCDVTEWVAADGEICHTSEIYSNGANVFVLRKCTTPAQAIAATMGRGTCRRLPADNFGTTCVVRGHGYEMEFGYWKCSECGTNCFEGARYCMNCGARVVDAC